jgi:tetratricopeptide (TPR) repeat protein
MRDYPASLKDLEEAVAIAPNLVSAYEKMALIHLLSGDSPEAVVNACTRPFELGLSSVDCHIYLGWGYKKLGEPTAEFDSFDQQAFNHFNIAIQESRSPVTLVNAVAGRGVMYLTRGVYSGSREDLEQAEKDFNKALALDPTYKLVYLWRAQARYFMGDLPEAMLDCKAVAPTINTFIECFNYSPQDAVVFPDNSD